MGLYRYVTVLQLCAVYVINLGGRGCVTTEIWGGVDSNEEGVVQCGGLEPTHERAYRESELSFTRSAV